jgi:uncharacterized protein with HEPN domain
MNALPPKLIQLLLDMRNSAERIVTRLADEPYADFVSPGFSDAKDVAARHLGIIGEAAGILIKNFPEFCEQNLSAVEVRAWHNMRNILVHNYGGVNWDIVWNTTQNELPDLIQKIRFLLGNDTVSPDDRNVQF